MESNCVQHFSLQFRVLGTFAVKNENFVAQLAELDSFNQGLVGLIIL